MLTVKDLKDIIYGVPDSASVYIQTPYAEEYETTIIQFSVGKEDFKPKSLIKDFHKNKVNSMLIIGRD